MSHAADLEAALNAFCKGLTERWQEAIYRAVTTQTTLPLPYSVYSHYYQPPWNHLEAGTDLVDHFIGCKALKWYDDGRNGSIPSCCGFSTLLACAEDWAWASRNMLFKALPKFADHDLANLEAAYEGYKRTALALGAANPESIIELDADQSKPSALIQEMVSDIGADEDQWLAEWTGFAADTVKAGYVDSALPTLNNHIAIVICLGNFILIRAEIIRTLRESSLAVLGAGTDRLAATVTNSVDLVEGTLWDSTTATGLLAGMTGDIIALTPVGNLDKIVKVAGSGLRLLGWSGNKFVSSWTVEVTEYEFSPDQVVASVHTEILKMTRNLEVAEEYYRNKIAETRSKVNGVASECLELYDFGRNASSGGY
ncbi:hypothetical protein [Glycomyces sp. NRRL B-16210]|uniref:hypothetical protein n=1 Tax=Glycomyces sp. NRRL B-16210 TaxID=1463821 RepID=UPI0004BEE614|nr:hypothetical protein [Glycomyces sp. NRRL B-16210]